jgi:hypothetical protein
MQKTLSTLLWIKGREKANEYSGSHTPPKGFKQEPRPVARFFVYRHLLFPQYILIEVDLFLKINHHPEKD